MMSQFHLCCNEITPYLLVVKTLRYPCIYALSFQALCQCIAIAKLTGMLTNGNVNVAGMLI